MTSLAEVLAFKFPGVEGINTREKFAHPEPFDSFRDMEIFDWPTGQGPEPTQAQLNNWRGQFEALPVEKPVMSVEEMWEVLRSIGIITDANVPADRRQPPRRP